VDESVTIVSAQTKTRRSVLVRAIGWVLLGCVCAFAVVYIYAFARVWRQATRDEARLADVIIVFGAAEYAGRPSPVFRARLDHGYALYRQKLAPTIITTGGMAWDPTYSEGGVGRDYLASKGIADIHLIAETWSDNTAESAERVAKIMRTNGFKTCIAVSDPYHLFRIKRMMEAQGVETYTSPRPQTGMGFWSRVGHTMREAFSFTLWRLHLRFLLPDVVDEYFHKVK
jgi:uncharacterized SAM-binding protein YcdF (DUF218 family)